MLSKKHNTKYTASLPTAVGDRYYGQDLMRDINYLRTGFGRIPLDMPGGFTSPSLGNADVILTHGTVSLGANPFTQINIEQVIAYLKKEVTIPNNWSSLPPGITTDDIAVRLELPAQTDVLATGLGMTLDGTTHFLKLAHVESDVANSSRARAKKAGSYISELQDNYVLTIDKVPVVQGELELCRLAGDGVSDLIITHLNGSRVQTIGRLNWSSICPQILSLNANVTIDADDPYSVYFFDGGIIGTLTNVLLPVPVNAKGRKLVLKYIGLGTNSPIHFTDPFSEASTIGWFGKECDTYELLCDGVNWMVINSSFTPHDTGWVAKSTWPSSYLGTVNVVLGSIVGTPIIGETIREDATSLYGTFERIQTGTTYIISSLRGQAGAGALGSVGQFTATNAVTFLTSGATAVVSANTKNVSTPLFHGWPMMHHHLNYEIYIHPSASAPGLGASIIRIEAGNSGSNNSGITIFGDNAGKNRAEAYVQTGSLAGSSFSYLTQGIGSGGASQGISTSDYFYRVIAKFNGDTFRKIY